MAPELKPAYLIAGGDWPKVDAAIVRLRAHFPEESADPVAEMLSVTLIVTRSFTWRARRSPERPVIHEMSLPVLAGVAARAAWRYRS